MEVHSQGEVGDVVHGGGLHELAFAREAADRVVFMDAGRVVETGSAEAVLSDPREARTRAFLGAFLGAVLG